MKKPCAMTWMTWAVLVVSCVRTAPVVGQSSSGARITAPVTAPSTTFVQPGTKFPFPDTVEGFERSQMQRFGRDDSDVRISYMSKEPNRVNVTVYVFPAPKMTAAPGEIPEAVKARQVKQVLESIKKDIASIKVDTKPVSEGEYELKEGGRTHKGIKTTSQLAYTIGDKKDVYDFQMMMFVEGDWVFEYRLYYLQANAAIAKPLVEKFLAGLTWKAEPATRP